MHVYKPNVSSVLRNNTQVDALLLRQRQVTRFLPFWCDVITDTIKYYTGKDVDI